MFQNSPVEPLGRQGQFPFSYRAHRRYFLAPGRQKCLPHLFISKYGLDNYKESVPDANSECTKIEFSKPTN